MLYSAPSGSRALDVSNIDARTGVISKLLSSEKDRTLVRKEQLVMRAIYVRYSIEQLAGIVSGGATPQ